MVRSGADLAPPDQAPATGESARYPPRWRHTRRHRHQHQHPEGLLVRGLRRCWVTQRRRNCQGSACSLGPAPQFQLAAAHPLARGLLDGSAPALRGTSRIARGPPSCRCAHLVPQRSLLQWMPQRRLRASRHPLRRRQCLPPGLDSCHHPRRSPMGLSRMPLPRLPLWLPMLVLLPYQQPRWQVISQQQQQRCVTSSHMMRGKGEERPSTKCSLAAHAQQRQPHRRLPVRSLSWSFDHNHAWYLPPEIAGRRRARDPR